MPEQEPKSLLATRPAIAGRRQTLQQYQLLSSPANKWGSLQRLSMRVSSTSSSCRRRACCCSDGAPRATSRRMRTQGACAAAGAAAHQSGCRASRHGWWGCRSHRMMRWMCPPREGWPLELAHRWPSVEVRTSVQPSVAQRALIFYLRLWN